MISKHFKLYELAPKVLFNTLNDRLLWSMFDDGLIKFDEASGTYVSTTKTVKDYDVIVDKAAVDSITWSDSVAIAKAEMEKIGSTDDESVARIKESK